MKIGIYQMNIVWEDKEQNLAKAEQAMITAVNNNADVLFMPEMSFTGFSMNTKKTAEDNNYTVDKMKQLCKKHNIAVGFGWVRNCGEKSANCYSVIDKNGELLSTYEKIHPFSYAFTMSFTVEFSMIVSRSLFFSHMAGISMGCKRCPLSFPKSIEPSSPLIGINSGALYKSPPFVLAICFARYQ